MDAIAVVVSDQGCAALSKDAAAIQLVMDAFGHLKAIGGSLQAKSLLDKAGVVADAGVVGLDDAFIAAAKLRYFDREPKLPQLA